MTAQQIVTRVRELLSDDYVGYYRWSDAVMFTAITEACVRLAEKRPDSLFTSTVPTTNIITTITALTDVLQINDRYKEALESYVCYRCIQRDSEDNANMALADKYLEKFEYTLS